ncbi:MAG TPA: efflux RND transporter periplasmic adaptor subunit [Burkholderiaceae bacterium]|nr:efflux RND transporter periplasmic adaptor subunit [Burkholderiaceae bacterium]
MSTARRSFRPGRVRILGTALLATTLLITGCGKDGGNSKAEAKSAARPALTVTVTTAQRADWPRTLTANGNVTAWQEAVIGAELSGLRVTDVLVNVGDSVKRGQPLASIATEGVLADLAQAKASVAEAEAALVEARANAERSKQLQAQGFISSQATIQVVTAEQTAAARLAAARARVQAEDVRLAQSRVVAPDDGVISARTATVGSLTTPNQEMFRLIRGGRLEWRAEVTASELQKLEPGMRATLTTASGTRIEGTVRAVAPSVDPATRNGLVYVDLPPGGARAGTFARGEFQLGSGAALTVPQSAVVLRDGFAYVFTVSTENKVMQSKVEVGRRVGDRIEILAGLPADGRLVESGAGFLSDGDVVRVVETPVAPVKAAEK